MMHVWILSRRVRIGATVMAMLAGWIAASADVEAQSSSSAPRAARRPARAAVDGPNRASETDAAAGELIDSLFQPLAPQDPLGAAATKAVGVSRSKASQRANWAGRLVRNPRKGDGRSPYALVDEFGGIKRYVEPSPGIDLGKHVGQTVSVRRDTGQTLLASQLMLPGAPGRSAAGRVAGAAPPRPYGAVRLAAAEEAPTPLEPVPASEPTPAEGEVLPMAENAMPEGAYYQEGPMMESAGPVMEGADYGMPAVDNGPVYLDSGIDFGGCPTCGDQVCGGRGCAQGGCGFGSRPVWYARGEYLLWWFDGMNTPPLVIEGTPQDADGDDNFNVDDNGNGVNDDLEDDELVPFDANTPLVVYGGNKILTDPRSGFRIRLGYWLDDYGKRAIEGDYYAFGSVSETYVSSTTAASLMFGTGRPYIDPVSGLRSFEKVTYPGGLQGTATVSSDSEFQSAGIRLRRNLCCVSGDVGCGDCVTCGSAVGGCDSCGMGGAGCGLLPFLQGGTRHVDMTYGVRWASLDESLRVREDLRVIDTNNDAAGFPLVGSVGDMFEVNDRFYTSNEFVGGELGFIWDWERRRWSLEMIAKLAIGNTRQRVAISGDTTRTDVADDDQTRQGGLLAQPTNIGVRRRNQLSVLPELGVTVGFLLTERLRLTGGYTFMYWSRVVRPGDQIDLEVNPAYLDFDTGNDLPPDHPAFVFRDTDIWAHGINAGLDYRW